MIYGLNCMTMCVPFSTSVFGAMLCPIARPDPSLSTERPLDAAVLDASRMLWPVKSGTTTMPLGTFPSKTGGEGWLGFCVRFMSPSISTSPSPSSSGSEVGSI